MFCHSLGPLVLSLVFICSCASGVRQGVPPLRVVPRVDLNRYLGAWHEIARFPHRFQEGCVATQATYTLLEGGKIEVLNQCRKNSLEGELSTARGKAWVVDPETNAKLKVRFFWPFSGDYWIMYLDQQYRYVLVGDPDRKYLWILCREKTLDEPTYMMLLQKATDSGYDIADIIRVEHDCD